MADQERDREDNMLDDPEALDIEEGEDEQEFMDDPQIQIATLIEERDNLRDKWMRALAEGENLRKRSARDRRDAELYGGTKLARDLLSVFDNMSRALDVIDTEIRERQPALVEGIELTQRELLNVFEKHSIQLIRPEIGEKFDPNLHQAMFEAPVPNHEPGTIIQVMTEGFKVGERLLRAAQVGVASAAR